MFGIDSEKLVILGIIAAVVLGPKRLPEYARKLAEWIKKFRAFADNAGAQLSEELGEEVDWRKLDPRQYDPRRIIREALTEQPIRGYSASVAAASKTSSDDVKPSDGAFESRQALAVPLAAGETAPFDGEAT